jgi:hypothetical protein
VIDDPDDSSVCVQLNKGRRTLGSVRPCSAGVDVDPIGTYGVVVVVTAACGAYG